MIKRYNSYCPVKGQELFDNMKKRLLCKGLLVLGMGLPSSAPLFYSALKSIEFVYITSVFPCFAGGYAFFII